MSCCAKMQHLQQTASDKCTDGDMATLIITLQKTMTSLQKDTEEDRFAVIMRAVYVKIRVTISPIRSCNTTPLYLSDLYSPQEGGNSMIH
jgi:hypothetical protein